MKKKSSDYLQSMAYSLKAVIPKMKSKKKKNKKKDAKLTYFLKGTFPSIIQVKLKPYKWIEISIDRQRNLMIKWSYRAKGLLRLFSDLYSLS